MALVFRIISDCPACGKKLGFGCISVRPDHVHMGCSSCRFREDIPLPPLKKKVLYLDQVFFSRAFRRSANSQKYIDAVARLGELAERQVLVVPYSSVHEDETYQWITQSAHLMEFIKATSGGFKAEPPYEVQHAQLLSAFSRYRTGEDAQTLVEPTDALPDDVHGWADYIWIGLTNDYYGNASQLARTKDRTVEKLIDLFPTWRLEVDDFNADLLIEYQGAASTYVEAFNSYVDRLNSGDVTASLTSHVNSRVIEEMLMSFDKEVSVKDRVSSVLGFFASDHFRAAAYQLIFSRSIAVLRSQVRGGMHKNRERALKRFKGLFLDLEHIATYAPYCDAIFVDNAMATMICDPRVDVGARFGTQVFCDAKWNEFIDWLSSLDADLPPEHLEGLAVAYPASLGSSLDRLRAVK